MPLRKLMILLHANLKDPTDVGALSRTLCLSPDIAPLADLGFVPSLDLPKQVPLLPKRSLRLG
eukprot:9602966-Alexandrium_andersonii.AAC.1